jgi:uncharacterized protein with ParB-like and HNH nuclease domain
VKADAVPLLDLFEKKMRLEVPLFQRQYVWSLEQQWEPLWEDVSRKCGDFIEGRPDGPVHFLGAMVLDQKQTPVTHVEKRQVIDGQQRLTTLQIMLSVMRDFCSEHGCTELAQEFEKYTLNTGKMAEPDVDRFKVWPTQLDRAYFIDVMTLTSRAAIEEKHPLVRRRYQRKPDPRPRIIEAYLYFHEKVRDFFLGTDEEPPLAAATPLEDRIDATFRAMKSALQIVAIDLDQDDDPQVIFETLNARGEPLLPADLLRNYIFLRAGRANKSQEALYEKYWKGFDDEFWREDVTQGRLSRPRSDLFMQHFLASRRAVDIAIKHLYVEYRHWIEREKPFNDDVEHELRVVSRQRDNFRRVLEPQRGDPIYGLATFMERFDVRTAYPLMLHLLELGLDDDAWRLLSNTIESYLLRRAVMGWSTKAYNRIFLSLVKSLQKLDPADIPRGTEAALASLAGDSSAWPTDDKFAWAWMNIRAYEELNRDKVTHILRRLNATYQSSMTEQVTIDSELTIEHIMPQSWWENWSLADGTPGLGYRELIDADPGDARAEATQNRERAIHTFGNLTLLTQELNSSVSNSGWAEKQPALLAASLLPLNLQLRLYEAWDEDTIASRGRELLEKALLVWPRPASRAKTS